VADLLSLDSEIVEMSGGHGFGLGRAFWDHAGLPRRRHHGRAGDDEAEGEDPSDDGWCADPDRSRNTRMPPMIAARLAAMEV
jgi:hypothetical protein